MEGNDNANQNIYSFQAYVNSYMKYENETGQGL